MADEPDTVTIRNVTTEETQEIAAGSVPFFVNDNWVVLTKDGRVNPKPAAALTTTDKDK